MQLHVSIIISLVLMMGCQTKPDKPIKSIEKMNILWLVAEDLGPYIPPFGDSTIKTPHLSRLAAEGVRYNNVFSVSGVCSPSRAALATGMYPSSIGAHHMRTLYQQPAAKNMGIINYEVVLPAGVKMVSEILRENGYYTTNNAKEDYQFFPSKMAWDESSNYAHWRNRPIGKPFYSMFSFMVTHESSLWNPVEKIHDLEVFPPAREMKSWWKQFENKFLPLVDENLSVVIPPYLPNTDKVVNDVRRMYSNISRMDDHVGNILTQLEEDDLLENTIIVWFTDHGGPLPRQKRLLYDAGLQVPMIVRYPDKWRAGEIDNRLISFVDFAPTLLSMTEIKPPEYMQGLAFEGKFKVADERKFIHAAADRFDETYDMIRAVRDKRFKYLKNFQPQKPYYLPLAYRENMGSMQELLRLNAIDSLNEKQALWFRKTKPNEELFDTHADPHELNNLAEDPQFSGILSELRRECETWMHDVSDMGHIPEQELINTFWPDKIQPLTANPVLKVENGELQITCQTEGASIGYKRLQDLKEGLGWQIYTAPIGVDQEEPILVIAHRIGFAPSDTLQWN